MPAKHYIDNEAKLIITTWEGEAIAIDLIEAIKKYQEDIQCHPDYINYNEVVGLNKVTAINLTTTDLMNIGKIASITDSKEIGRKLAFISSSNKTFFFVRMYKAYRSFSRNSNKDIRIFTTECEAFEWVQNNTDNG